MRIRYRDRRNDGEWLPAWRVGDGAPPDWIEKAKKGGWALDGPRGSLLIYADRFLYAIAHPGSIVFLKTPVPKKPVRLATNEFGCIDIVYIKDYWEVDGSEE